MEAEKKLLLPQNEHGAFLIRVNFIFFYFFGIVERSWMGAIEIVVNLEVACYKKKARQNLEYKVFTFRFINI